MKLSEALELCIEKEFYSLLPKGYQFMCHALWKAELTEHVPAVMAMVKTLNPMSEALASALGSDWECDLDSPEAFELCKAHYIKWIAELKEQGL